MNFEKLKYKIFESRAKGIHNYEIAEKTKINVTKISKILSGKINPTLKDLEKFSKYFNCKINDLMED